MGKRHKTLILIPFLVSTAYSQTVTPTVISSNGGYSQTAQGSIAWSIGEPVSETYSTSAHLSTMGFHQPEQLDLITLINEQGTDAGILVYPNPVFDKLHVKLPIENGNYQLELADAIGRIVLKTETTVVENGSPLILSLGGLSGGVYYLKISRTAFEKTIKINKVN